MTRVLHVVECYDAGVGRAVDRWITLSPQHEHHLLWEGLQSPDDVEGVMSHLRMPAGFLARIRAVRQMVNGIHPDVVVAHSSWAGVYTRARSVDAPVLYAPHAYKFEDPLQHPLLRAAYRGAEGILAKRTYATITLTPREDALARSLDQQARTLRVPNASTLAPGASHRPSDRVDNTIAMIGRISPQKSPDFFLEVASRVREQNTDAHFVWAGDGDVGLRNQLEASGVEVTGWLKGKQLRDFLERPFVYFHSAGYEGFPLSVLDAAAFGHPVIVRDIPAFDGLDLWRCESTSSAARAILSVLERGSGHRRAASAAESLVKHMNEEVQAAAVDAVLSEFHNRSARRHELTSGRPE
ncbi:glycosyltransferase [Microbacterium sp. SLBN-146]|uniref:glycosyltransferase n=1 Tax=Microbacterium sp. SLBN-146 TaxID=2768457 RepID=UPI00114F5194|nr:glycosyltransferase [Microbacterium sp. SLBN-146]TQJ29699.1 glycosyltransferase involved in cell wall biosynthesis [Microbacterium sp. SLBN-146]